MICYEVTRPFCHRVRPILGWKGDWLFFYHRGVIRRHLHRCRDAPPGRLNFPPPILLSVFIFFYALDSTLPIFKIIAVDDLFIRI